jgi:hypothetical protein
MIYRIMRAPPGYAREGQYMVGAYWTLDFDSFAFNVMITKGSTFTLTLDEARQLIPIGAKKLAFEPRDQFLELWKA